MHYTPHDYQAQAINYICTHPQCVLLLDMGLGKTVITLTAIQALLATGHASKVLVIAPLRVARDTWPTELNKWDHLHPLQASVVVGDKATRLAALATDADIYIINRENVDWLINHSGHDWDFDTVIIDELSSFKSTKAARFKALKKVRPHIRRIIGLTGTPTSNGLMDLFAQFRLIDEGERLGTYITHYREKYFVPDKRSRTQIFSWKPRKHGEQHIYDAIADITLSMRTVDYLTLPPLTTTTYTVHVPDPARKAYDQFKANMVTELAGDIIDAANAAVLAGKLQQLANGALYTDTDTTAEVHAAKLDALEDLVEAANGKPLLVAYWFKHDAARIKNRFTHARELSSSQDFTEWNSGKVPLALIHPASAGHGLNLQAGGSILVWFSLTWSLELYQQTNARLYRQGQTEPVTIIHIATAGTVDEKIMAALESKNVTQSALIEAVKAELNPKMERKVV